MSNLVILFIHFLATLARLLGPVGVRSIVAESLILKHQLLIVARSRQRSPNLCTSDRILAGLIALLVRSTEGFRTIAERSRRSQLHKALSKQKYRVLFSPNRRRQPGAKGPSAELIRAVVEMRQHNPNWGCPRIAQQIALAFHIPIDKHVVRRILGHHYRPGQPSGGPFWLTFLGHMKDSLWSSGSVPVRVGNAADPLGPDGHGSIYAPDHWFRRSCGIRQHVIQTLSAKGAD
jgi:putative transposase